MAKKESSGPLHWFCRSFVPLALLSVKSDQEIAKAKRSNSENIESQEEGRKICREEIEMPLNCTGTESMCIKSMLTLFKQQSPWLLVII